MILLHELRRELSIVLSMVGQSFPVASFHATIIDGAPVILIFHNGRALFTFFLIFYFLPFQRPSAASARQRARRAGSLVTASSSRMSRPSRLTGARTWRWVHCPPLRLIVKTLLIRPDQPIGFLPSLLCYANFLEIFADYNFFFLWR